MNCARSRAVLRMMRTCLSCSSVSSPSRRWSKNCEIDEDRIDRRPQLVPHVGQERDLRSAARRGVFGPLVELGVQRHHAAVRVLELAVSARELVLSRCAARRVGCIELLVLLAALARPPRAPPRREVADDLRQRRGHVRRVRGSALSDRRSCPSGPASMSKVSTSRRAPTMPRPIPVARQYAAGEHAASRSAMPRPPVGDPHDQDAASRGASTQNSTFPPPAYRARCARSSEIAVAPASDLVDVEAEQPRDLTARAGARARRRAPGAMRRPSQALAHAHGRPAHDAPSRRRGRAGSRGRAPRRSPPDDGVSRPGYGRGPSASRGRRRAGPATASARAAGS